MSLLPPHLTELSPHYTQCTYYRGPGPGARNGRAICLFLTRHGHTLRSHLGCRDAKRLSPRARSMLRTARSWRSRVRKVRFLLRPSATVAPIHPVAAAAAEPASSEPATSGPAAAAAAALAGGEALVGHSSREPSIRSLSQESDVWSVTPDGSQVD